MSNPVFWCEDLASDDVVLAGSEGRHAATVRRIRVGEQVDLVDGRGTRCTSTVVATTRDTLSCTVTERVMERIPSPTITVVQALPKGNRGELAVALATEVGVDSVVPWAAARCVAVWGDGTHERWRSTAREAAKQSRRAWFPVVSSCLATAAVAQLPGQLLVLHEAASSALSSLPLPPGDLVLVVGPEGGVAPEELEAFQAAGAVAVRLGASVLRTSTAGAVAAALVSARIGRW